MNTYDTRYTVEPGLARGWWVIDSEDVSTKTHARSQSWFHEEDEALDYASLMNLRLTLKRSANRTK